MRSLSPRVLWPLAAATAVAAALSVGLAWSGSGRDARPAVPAPEARFLAATNAACARLSPGLIPAAAGRGLDARAYANAALPGFTAVLDELRRRRPAPRVRPAHAALVAAYARVTGLLERQAVAGGPRWRVETAVRDLRFEAQRAGMPSCGGPVG